MQLTSTKHVTITIEQITGRFCLRPQSRLIFQAERTMQGTQFKSPGDFDNLAEHVARARYAALTDEIESRATTLGWEHLKMMTMDGRDIKSHFGSEMKFLTWLRREIWGKDWMLAVSIGGFGEKWFVCKM